MGKVVSVETQEVAGFELEMFVIAFEKDKMTLRVPTHKALDVGMRSLATPDVVAPRDENFARQSQGQKSHVVARVRRNTSKRLTLAI